MLACQPSKQKQYKVFRYNQTNHISSLDPAFAKSQNNIWATHHIFNGLLRLDDDLNIESDIAKSWKISDDGKTYTFLLKDDVFFHEHPVFTSKADRRVTAHDVAYSLNRLIDPSINSPGSWLFSDKLAEQGFTAVNDSLFQIHLREPFLPLLGILTMQYCSVVSPKVMKHYGTQAAYHPIGTGPFAFKRWEANQGLYLIKNKDYFGSIPDIDGIKTSFIPDKKIAFLEILRGKLDYMSGVESSFLHDYITKQGRLKPNKSSEIKFQKAPFLNMEYIGIHPEASPDSPLKHKAFRQALNYAIDRTTLLKTLRNGIGIPAQSGIIPPGLPDYDSSLIGYRYDPNKAKELLASLKLPKPISLTIHTNKDYLDLVTMIIKQWEQLGIKTNIEVVESNILRSGMRQGDISLFRASWIADYPDAESFLCLFYSKYPAPPNYTRFSDPLYDTWYEASIRERDPKKRYALHQQMNAKIIEEAPVIFLFYDETAQFFSNRTSGISSNALNLLKIDHIALDTNVVK